MIENVIWTKLAQKDFDAIIAYFKKEASEQVIDNFHQLLEDKLQRLEKYPESGRLVEVSRQIYVINLDKYRQMFYRLDDTSLYISRFFDTRQNPDKRPY
jgi:plasmid stabilization system protein ParE